MARQRARHGVVCLVPYRSVRTHGLALVVLAIVTACSSPSAVAAPTATSRVPSFGPITPPTARPAGAPATPAPGTTAADPAIFWLEAPILGEPTPFRAVVPLTGAVVEPGRVRLLRPTRLPATRRVAIQIGHWKVDEAPDELPSLRFQGGGSFDGVDEVDLNIDIARKVAALLRGRGIVVELLPTTIPPGYLADAFVSLHADGDDYGEASGFKIAHGFYRGPHEDALVSALTDTYADATGLSWNDNVSSDMTDYYGFAWYRYEHALSPFTPAAILEMGYLSHADDRAVLLEQQSSVAKGIADGITRFLAEKPRSVLFAQDIVVETVAPPK